MAGPARAKSRWQAEGARRENTCGADCNHASNAYDYPAPPQRTCNRTANAHKFDVFTTKFNTAKQTYAVAFRMNVALPRAFTLCAIQHQLPRQSQRTAHLYK